MDTVEIQLSESGHASTSSRSRTGNQVGVFRVSILNIVLQKHALLPMMHVSPNLHFRKNPCAQAKKKYVTSASVLGVRITPLSTVQSVSVLFALTRRRNIFF